MVHLIGGDPEEERPRPCSTNVALVISNLEAVLTRLEQHGVTYVSLARQPRDVTIRADGLGRSIFKTQTVTGSGSTVLTLNPKCQLGLPGVAH